MDEQRTQAIQRRYNRVARIYDLLESPMEHGKFGEWREGIWQKVAEYAPKGGRVLEVGVGTGKNIPYYPQGVEMYAIDFSEQMLKRAREKADQLQLKVKLSLMDIQKIDFPNDYFDVIVSTCVFCSVPDPLRGFRELHRVCKPDGKLFLLEHVRSERPLLGKMMDLMNPLTVRLWGANINRRTLDTIGRVEFADVHTTDVSGDIVKEIVITNGK